jgi:hypothetical protein
MHWLSPRFYMEAKFDDLSQKGKKRMISIEIQFFRRTAECTFWPQKECKILEELKVEPVDEKLRR